MACHLMELMGIPGEVSGKSTIAGVEDTHFDMEKSLELKYKSSSLVINNFNNYSCKDTIIISNDTFINNINIITFIFKHVNVFM